MLVAARVEPLAHKVPNVSEDNENQVTDVRREQYVIRRVLGDVHREGLARRVLAGHAVLFGSAVAKLGVHRRKDLLRGGRPGRQEQAILVRAEDGVVHVVVFMQDRVL